MQLALSRGHKTKLCKHFHMHCSHVKLGEIRLDFFNDSLTSIESDINLFYGRDSPGKMNITSVITRGMSHYGWENCNHFSLGSEETRISCESHLV